MAIRYMTLSAAAIALAAGHAAAQNCNWDPSPVGPGTTVRELMVYNDNLYAGGSFSSRAARWDGFGWSDPGMWLDRAINSGASAVWDDGSGPALYVGGSFSIVANKFGRWDGTWMTDLGTGSFGTATSQNISSMAVWNNAVYVGGAFNTTHNTSPSAFNHIARWDGTSLTDVAGGTNGTVNTMAVYQGELHIFGAFTEAGGVPTGRGARWDGTTFHPVPFDIPSGSAISGSLAWDDGTGPALYVHGSFATISGVTVNGIGRWDGTAWSDLAGGATTSAGGSAWISSATIFDDGVNERLYIGSHNTSAMAFIGGNFAQRIAWWDGQYWTGLMEGPDHTIFTMRQFNDVTGEPVLWVGGQFGTVSGVSNAGIARWVCDAPPFTPCYADCDGNDILNIDDFICFINEFAQAQALPPAQQITHYANCTGSTSVPILNIDDFICFINEFAQGCP